MKPQKMIKAIDYRTARGEQSASHLVKSLLKTYSIEQIEQLASIYKSTPMQRRRDLCRAITSIYQTNMLAALLYDMNQVDSIYYFRS